MYIYIYLTALVNSPRFMEIVLKDLHSCNSIVAFEVASYFSQFYYYYYYSLPQFFDRKRKKKMQPTHADKNVNVQIVNRESTMYSTRQNKSYYFTFGTVWRLSLSLQIMFFFFRFQVLECFKVKINKKKTSPCLTLFLNL
jgi:hypothetical protein